MYNRQNKTNSLVEAGLIVSLMIVLIMLNLYFPIFSIFITFFITYTYSRFILKTRL